MTLLTTNLPLATAQIGHAHNLDHQARPSGEMLRSLTLACLRIILLPRKTCFHPLVVDGLDEIEAETAIQLSGFGLMGPGGLCIFLFRISRSTGV